MEGNYSKREIELMFENIKTLLQQIRSDIKTHAEYSENRFKSLKKDIDSLRDEVQKDISDLSREVDDFRSFKTRALAIWSVVITVATIIVNKLW